MAESRGGSVGDQTSGIANKFRRREVYARLKRERKAEKRKARKRRKLEDVSRDDGSDGSEENEDGNGDEREREGDDVQGKDGDGGVESGRDVSARRNRVGVRTEQVTIESARVRDDEASAAVPAEQMITDETVIRTQSGREPKVLLTTCRKPSAGVFAFIAELLSFFPVASFFKRRDYEVRRIARYASKRGFTALLVINEDSKKINGLLHVNLPAGPMAHYKLTNLKLAKDIANHGRPTDHTPEIILNNFSTAMGHRVAHMFASLFCPDPEFKGRRVVTFHNQRDFIFVRHHRYIFNERARSSDGSRPRRVITRLQELGPRFTLRLLKLQSHLVPDSSSQSSHFSWRREIDGRDADKTRRKFAL